MYWNIRNTRAELQKDENIWKMVQFFTSHSFSRSNSIKILDGPVKPDWVEKKRLEVRIESGVGKM